MKEIGKISYTQLGYLDGHYTFYIGIDFGSNSQGFGGYSLGGEFTDKVISGILKAVGVETWEELKGKIVMARIEEIDNNDRIVEIQAPKFVKDTTPFNLKKIADKYQTWVKK